MYEADYLTAMGIVTWQPRSAPEADHPLIGWELIVAEQTVLLILDDSRSLREVAVRNLLAAMLGAIGYRGAQLDLTQAGVDLMSKLEGQCVIAMGAAAQEFARARLDHFPCHLLLSHPKEMLASPNKKREAWGFLRGAFLN